MLALCIMWTDPLVLPVDHMERQQWIVQLDITTAELVDVEVAHKDCFSKKAAASRTFQKSIYALHQQGL